MRTEKSAAGAIAAGHPSTAEAGARILAEGGNAIDAAVCAVLTSFAVESPLTGLGGGGYMLVHTPSGDDHLIDFAVEAPGRGVDISRRGRLVPKDIVFDETPQIFNVGPASCGVYGTPAGLWEAGRRFGTVPMSELVAPAIRYAREGSVVLPQLAYIFELLEPIFSFTPETRALYAPEGRLLAAGDRFRFPDLADALERYAAEGPEPFYRGDIALRVSDWLLSRGGIVSVEDLLAYRAFDRPGVRVGYRGREVVTNPPPSSGGVLVAFCLRLLERLCESASVEWLVEVMEEAARVRTEDFTTGLGAPGFSDLFLGEENIERSGAAVASRAAALPRVRESSNRLGSTTHISVLDAEGYCASVTCSNGSCSGVLVPGTGIHMNNMLGEEDLNPHGFHAHAPGTRIPSMMTPTVVTRAGRVELALGSAGSNRIRSAVLQTIVGLVDHGRSVEEGVARGRIHYEDGVVHAEPGVDPAALDVLAAAGYTVERWAAPNLYFGGVQAVACDLETGALTGAGDPRRGGAVRLV